MHLRSLKSDWDSVLRPNDLVIGHELHRVAKCEQRRTYGTNRQEECKRSCGSQHVLTESGKETSRARTAAGNVGLVRFRHHSNLHLPEDAIRAKDEANGQAYTSTHHGTHPVEAMPVIHC